MAKGFVAGAIWGIVASGVGAGLLSVAVGLPPAGPGPDAVTDVATATAPAARDTPPDAPAEQDVAPDVAATIPKVTEPAQETSVAAGVAPTVPVIGSAPDALAADGVVDEDVTVRVVTPDETPLPAGMRAAPGAPDAGVTPEAPPETPSETPPEAATLPAADPSGEEPDALAAETAQDAPDTEAAVAVEPDLAPEPAPDASPIVTANEGDADASQSASSQIGVRVGSLIDRKPAGQTRLPTVNGSGSNTPGSETATAAGIAPDSPLMTFAVPFTAEPGVPRMAVVLIDDGTAPMGPAQMETMPFPVTFAITPGHPEAAATAWAYRDRGFEVLALTSVPEGATASDVEVALAGTLDAVPGAVGALEDPSGPGLQGSREVAAQATAYLGASGHGLVMEPNGLNTAQKLAVKAGVPAVSVFRDLDGEGQDEGLIRRTLDQAAFRARQEGSVVMLGRLRAGTISALVLWGLQDRGNTITLVPISTVLKESVSAPTE